MKRFILLSASLMMLFQMNACTDEDNAAEMSNDAASLYSDGTGTDVALGDVDGDGALTSVDALKIAQFAAGQTPDDFIANAADVNCDADITTEDANLVAQAATGTVDGFSCRAQNFESLVDWTTPSGLSLAITTTASQGDSALAIDGSGWGEITSSPLYPESVSDKITLDVRKSIGMTGWHGQLAMSLNCHSQGIYNAYLGNINLNDLAGGTFSEVVFQLSGDVQAALQNGCDELSVAILANLVDAVDPLVLDNLRFDTEDTDMGECKDVYENHNNPTDASRYNVVIVTRGFENESAELAALRRIIDLDRSETIPSAYGMMQMAPFIELHNRFNFFYVTSSVAEPITDGWAALSEWQSTSQACQQYLPNNVYAFLLQPNTGDNTVWVASWGRAGAGLADCRTSQDCAVGALHGAVHEMMHSIFFLPDEYEAYPGQEPLTFDLENDTLDELQQVFMWAGDNYEDCIANAPWSDMIGDGCGDDGVIDCIDTSKCPLPLAGDWSNYITPGQCCFPEHPDCFAEVACFEGIQYYDTNLWRATGENLMRNHWFDGYAPANYFSLVQQDHIIEAVLNGPDSL